MRYALLLALCALSCAAEPVLLPDASTPDAGPCGGACGAGTSCVAGACVVDDAGAPDAGEADSGAAVDVGEDRPVVDAGALDAGPVDAGGADAVDVPAPPMDTGPVFPDAGCIRATQCGAGCFDLTTAAHCGACGVACNASQVCGVADGGRACVSRCTGLTPDWCWRGTAAGGATRENFCTNLASDNLNCGGCAGDRCTNGVRHGEHGACVRN